MRLAQTIKSASFRLAFAYVLLFAASFGVLAAITYFSVTAELSRQFHNRIAAESHALQSDFRTGGVPQLLRTISERQRGHLVGGLDYSLVDANGSHVFGTMPIVACKPGWTTIIGPPDGDEDPGEMEELGVYVTPLSNGMCLFVGSDWGEVQNYGRVVLKTFAWVFLLSLTLAVAGGLFLVSQAAIDTAVARLLTFKFRAGLFENPWGDAKLAAKITGNAEARALALEAARKSLCLLSNDGILPLKPGAQKIAVIGPNAAIARLGGYSSFPKQRVSLLDGVRARVGDAAVIHAQGAFITTTEDLTVNEVTLANPEKNRALIAEAVEAARGADVILLAIGDTELTSREGFAKNHLGDRADLDLLGEQNALFEALHALGKPVVVVAINGRPASWPTVAAKANAILECWYAGQEGGTAIAEALFGDINPGAKLPVTVIRDVGQIPSFYNHKPSARRGYLFDDAAPLFPFGHGLSYTSFEVGKPALSATSITPDGTITITVDVTNTGKRAGDEVVQLYIRHLDASVTQPVMALKGFQRVTLAPGETRKTGFTLGPKAFRIWNVAMQEVVEPGRIEIMAGNSSANVKSTTLIIA